MNNDLSAKIGKATVWSSVTEILAKLITPIVNMILARLLMPEAFGIVATITMVISFAEVFADAGFQKYVIQHEFENDEELDKSTNVAFWTNLSVSALVCALVFVFRHKLAHLVGSDGLGNSISIASLLIILTAFSSIQMARYRRALDFKTLFFVRMGSAVIPLVVTVPLAILLKSYWALVIGNFASQLFNAVMLTARSKWKPKFYYSFRRLRQMFAFSGWSLLESISIWLTNYIGVFIVGRALDDYYLGLYKTSMSTVNSYMAIITAAITPVVFSALSRYQNDEASFRKTYYSFQRLTAVFIVPMGIGIFLFSDLVTEVLLGDQWMEAAPFVGLWGLSGALITVFSHFASEVYRSRGNPKLSLFSQLVHLAFVVPTLMIAVRHGFEVIYVARSVVRLQGVISSLLLLRLIYKFKLTDVIRNVFPMFVSALLMGAVGFGLKMIWDNMIWHFVVIFICVIVYFALLFTLFPSVRREVAESDLGQKLISKLRRKGS